MKKPYLFLTAATVLALAPGLLSAQYIVDYKRQADDYFSGQNYYAASVFYQKALNLLPDTSGKTYFYPYALSGTYGKRKEKNGEAYQYLVYRLGEAFRRYKDYKSAEQWYEKALQFKNDRFPLARLWYAVSLRADGRYSEAEEQLTQFQSSYTNQDEYSKRASLELESCKFAIDQLKYPRLADVQRLGEPVNDSGSNYAPVVLGNDFYFTSSRPVNGINRGKANPFINKLYHLTVQQSGRFENLAIISTGEDKQTEQAASAFESGRQRMYFTEWQQPRKKNKGERPHYSIVVSTMGSDSIWSPGISLGEKINVPGADSKEPFMTSDGKYLIFSSNRQGGQGGYDLWYCPLNTEGMPAGDAINMGNVINTQQDEANPYYSDQANTLVFSSNGRIGIGGFDLFKTVGMLGGSSWSPPVNMGYPVNSAKDDNFYYPVNDSTHFYTSSDRQSVCCLELYAVQLKYTAIAGTIYDCDSQKPVEGVMVTMTDSLGENILEKQTTDATGKYRFEVINHKPLKLNFSKENYFAKNMNVAAADLDLADTLFSKELCLKAFEVGKPIVIPNILYDFDKATLRPESKHVLDSLANILRDNPRLIVQMSANTDSVGSDDYNLKLSQRRAQSCVDYMISIGIPSSRMQAKGYGESRPIAPNSMPDGSDNPEGRQLNRRTEFTVLKD